MLDEAVEWLLPPGNALVRIPHGQDDFESVSVAAEHHAPGQNVPRETESARFPRDRKSLAKRRRILCFCRNDARMLLKTKDRCGKLAGKVGMSMKTHVLSLDLPECH